MVHAHDRPVPAGPEPTPWLERAAAAVGLVLTLSTFGLIGWQAFQDDSDPPGLTVEVRSVRAGPGGYTVVFRARNETGTAAAAVGVVGEMRRPDGAIEISRSRLDFLAGHSVRDGGLIFTADPRATELRVRVEGYAAP